MSTRQWTDRALTFTREADLCAVVVAVPLMIEHHDSEAS
jgi:hypothetical protein